ncbi:hypothetical protein HMPREF0580_2063 [Mobiluncus mulieris ATCC 35239]|uniref:SdpI/YhfL protein family n=2 Tax=Mobiluncus mulieris TaxID=2052 RepID=E0QT48_9ACTO|nr:hypothetical protein HMPREF0580_2063 [Mobiluncus mulieris ATCC 35239]
MRTMLAVLGFVGLTIVALVFFVEYMKARNRTLPLNHAVGLRTKAIMRNESTWAETHRRYAPIFLIDGLLFLSGGLYLGASVVFTKLSDSANYVVLAACCLVVLVNISIGLKATHFARGLNE